MSSFMSDQLTQDELRAWLSRDPDTMTVEDFNACPAAWRSPTAAGVRRATGDLAHDEVMGRTMAAETAIVRARTRRNRGEGEPDGPGRRPSGPVKPSKSSATPTGRSPEVSVELCVGTCAELARWLSSVAATAPCRPCTDVARFVRWRVPPWLGHADVDETAADPAVGLGSIIEDGEEHDVAPLQAFGGVDRAQDDLFGVGAEGVLAGAVVRIGGPPVRNS